MKNLPIIFLLVGILFIGGCVEGNRIIITKNTTEMILDITDLPSGWEVIIYSNDEEYENGGYTIVMFKNTRNNDTILSEVKNWKSLDTAENVFKIRRWDFDELIKSGIGYEINTANIFTDDTKCIAYTVPPSKNRNTYYRINCFRKNVQFDTSLTTKEPIKEENKELLLNLAKTIENKMIS